MADIDIGSMHARQHAGWLASAILKVSAMYAHTIIRMVICLVAGVEMKAAACAILRHRISLAGLTNVSVFCDMIERFAQPYDVALALHACGNATDVVLISASQQRAAYVVSPCCVGRWARMQTCERMKRDTRCMHAWRSWHDSLVSPYTGIYAYCTP